VVLLLPALPSLASHRSTGTAEATGAAGNRSGIQCVSIHRLVFLAASGTD